MFFTGYEVHIAIYNWHSSHETSLQTKYKHGYNQLDQLLDRLTVTVQVLRATSTARFLPMESLFS